MSERECLFETICAETGKSDSRELKAIKIFLDGFLGNRQGSEEEYEDYYRVSPLIIEAIRKEEDSKDTFGYLYDHFICNCVIMLDADDYTGALGFHRIMMYRLKERYLK